MFEYGFIEGFLKVSVSSENEKGFSTCLTEGKEILNTWTSLLTQWVAQKLETGESDTELEEEIIDEVDEVPNGPQTDMHDEKN